MSRRLRPFFLASCTLFWLGQGLASAQNASAKAASKEDDFYAFSIRVYRIPADDLLNGFVSKEPGQLRAPALPPATATHRELESFLKHDHGLIQEYLTQKGIVLPPGSLACYDPLSQTLALRTTAAAHGLMEPWSDAILRDSPKNLAWTINILEAPFSAIRATMKDSTSAADHTAAYERLLPQAKLVITMRGETKNAQKTESHQGLLNRHAVSYTIDNAERVQYRRKETSAGSKFELDPLILGDGRGIDLTLNLAHHPFPPAIRWGVVTAGSTPKIELQRVEHIQANIQTSIVLLSGETKLLGVWSLDRAADADRARGAAQAAFLRAVIVPLLPLPDSRVEQILRQRGEAVVTTPKGVQTVAEPTGMAVRRFRVPPDLLTSTGQEPAPAPNADPFATENASTGQPRFERVVTAEEILRAQGVTFPEGSSANYLPKTSELVVRNTEQNLDTVQMFIDSIGCHHPALLQFSLHVVQGEAALIRRLEQESFALPDHAAAWRAVEDAGARGQAKIVDSIWLETKSGHRATSENALLYESTTELALSKPAAQSSADDKEVSKPVAPQPSRDLEFVQDVTPVGLRLEVDPVIGADSQTIDLNLAFDYDYAPPITHAETDNGPEGVQRLAAPQTEFRRAHFNTATTMLSGSTRLLSVWKPSGTPELDGDILQAVFLRMDIVKVEPPTR